MVCVTGCCRVLFGSMMEVEGDHWLALRYIGLTRWTVSEVVMDLLVRYDCVTNI